MVNFILIIFAKYLILAIAISGAIYFLFVSKTKKKLFLTTALFSFAIAYTVAKISGLFFYNTRPLVLSGTVPLIAHTADNGFPSDHVLLAASIAFVVFAFNKKVGLILFLLTLLVGYARVATGLHHTLDVIGSILIAVCATYIVNNKIKHFTNRNREPARR